MPYAIVIHAFPKTDLSLDHAQGKILHGLFYEVLKKASAAKGEEVHSASGLKPFATALLLSEKQRRAEHLWPGELVRIRFTFLDDGLYPVLSRYFLSTPDLSLEMVRTELVVARVLATSASGERWAGYGSFEEIYDLASDENRTFAFDFSAPTFFKRGGGPAYPDLTVPLPLPELVFGSLLHNWNRFSSVPFEETPLLKDLCAHHMEVSHWQGRSQQARLVFRNGNGTYQTITVPGFVGRFSFRLLESKDPHLIKALNALADLAFYAGIGARTTMGFGVARRL